MGKTVPVKTFLKHFAENVKFICLTDKESEDDSDYVTGMNSNITFTTPENFLLAVNHAKISNTSYRVVEGFSAGTEIFVTDYMFRANKVQLSSAKPFTEAPFLTETKHFKYIIYHYTGAKYLIENNVPIPEAYHTYLLRKDYTLIGVLPSPSEKEVLHLINQDPYRIRYFLKLKDPQFITLALELQPYTLQYIIKSPLITPELINNTLEKNGIAIRFVPSPSPKQCEIAVKQTYASIQYIPNEFRSKALIDLAHKLSDEDTSTNIEFDSLLKFAT